MVPYPAEIKKGRKNGHLQGGAVFADPFDGLFLPKN